jgi:hypothetical protein
MNTRLYEDAPEAGMFFHVARMDHFRVVPAPGRPLHRGCPAAVTRRRHLSSPPKRCRPWTLWLWIGNTSDAGIVFMRPYRLNIGEWAENRENELEIRIAKLWSNAVPATPPGPGMVPGPGNGITGFLFGPSERHLMPSGLPGPVEPVRQQASRSRAHRAGSPVS